MIILFHPCKIWWNKLGSCNKDGWLQQDTINLDGKKKIEKNLQAFFLPFISKLFILIGDSSDLMRRRIPTKIRRQRPGCRWLRGRVSLTQPSSLTFLGITWLQQSATTTSSSFQQTSCRQKHHKWGKKEKKKNIDQCGQIFETLLDTLIPPTPSHSCVLNFESPMRGTTLLPTASAGVN